MPESIYITLAVWGSFHLLHPALACLPMGLLMGGFLFYLSSLVVRSPSLGQTAYHCLMLAWFSLLPAAVTGILDWRDLHGGALGGPILMKMMLLPLLVFLIGIVAWMMHRSIARPHRLLTGFLLCLLITLSLACYGARFIERF